MAKKLKICIGMDLKTTDVRRAVLISLQMKAFADERLRMAPAKAIAEGSAPVTCTRFSQPTFIPGDNCVQLSWPAPR
jgi:hypothetical protein